MAFWQACTLWLATLIGVLGSVAGGDSSFTVLTFLLLGMPAVNANATSAVALWPRSAASVGAYRAELGGEARRALARGAVGIMRGARTSSGTASSGSCHP